MIDDSTGFRAVMVTGRVDISEDLEWGLRYFRAIREKYGRAVPHDDAELLSNLQAEERVLLVIVPSAPPADWPSWGLD